MSEHISWNRFRGGDTRHSVLPFLGDDVSDTIVSNALELQHLTGLPVLLENAPRTFVLTLPDEVPEGDFIAAILERSGAGFLLDLESARATADALEQDLLTYLHALPLHRTVEIHLRDPFADRDLLLSILDIAPVRAITLNWDLLDRGQDEALVEAVNYLRERIGMGCGPCLPSTATPTALKVDTPVCLTPGIAVTLRDGRLRVTGGARSVRVDLPLETLPILAHFAAPQPVYSGLLVPSCEQSAAIGTSAAAVQTLLEVGALAPPQSASLDDGGRWADWDTALDFYLDTRTGADTEFATIKEMEETLSSKAARRPQPSAYKDYWAHPFLPLPNPVFDKRSNGVGASFLDVLLGRRTMRAFAPGPLCVCDLSALLFLVWGATSVQRNDLGDVFLRKTSPSGGSLHGAEVHPLLMNVEGFEPGVYHYSVRRHGLVLLSRDDPRCWIGKACGGQDWVAEAGAAFLVTFNIERLAWKYGFSRAFRAAMLDVGHLGQTFALVATYFGLAPFTTAALRDGIFEDRLGLDYLAEPVLMLNGVGKPDLASARPDRPRDGT
jgi:SagB-type dehydrogenase family enzyme